MKNALYCGNHSLPLEGGGEKNFKNNKRIFFSPPSRGGSKRLPYCVAFVVFLLGQALSARAESTIQHFQGPGGMAVYLVENHANPMVEVRLVARAGSAFDPLEKSGVSSLTGWMFNEGGGNMDAATFQERLTFHGISLGASTSRDIMTIRLTALTEQLDEAWSRLADALLRPRFDTSDFARAMDEQRASIIKDKEQPNVQASLLLYQKLYPHHPYGNPVDGTLESLARITLDDLRQFHTDAFHAPAMVLAVAGDVTLVRLKALIQKHLSGLNVTPSPFPPIPVAKPTQKGTFHQELVLPQTTLQLGTLGISRHDPDYYTFYVLNQILGGSGLSSRLNEQIREKRGLAYGVYSYFAPLEGGGPFVVGMRTKTASTQEALSLIRLEIQRLANEGVSALELQAVKRYLTGSFPLHMDGLGKLATLWSIIGYYQRGLDYLDKWPERINAVTLDNIKRVAQRLLDIDKFYTVTVGKKTAPQPQ